MKNLKKVLIVSIVLFTSVLQFSSCKKCSHCVVKASNGDILKDYLETCGHSKELKDYDATLKNDASQYNGTVTCTQ
jgi:hypothetical protein